MSPVTESSSDPRPSPWRHLAAHDAGASAAPRLRTGSGRFGPLFAALLVCLALGAAIAPAAEAAANPVLGAQAFTGPYGEGFGTAEPSSIFNGGDPSGSVSKIRWNGWGNPSAIGYGLNPIFKPGGGYYRKPARIELRATALGKCGDTRAYTRLEVRIPKHPGGKLGKWLLWSGAKTICKPPY